MLNKHIAPSGAFSYTKMTEEDYQIKRAALDQEFMEQKCTDEYYLRESASLDAKRFESMRKKRKLLK